MSQSALTIITAAYRIRKAAMTCPISGANAQCARNPWGYIPNSSPSLLGEQREFSNPEMKCLLPVAHFKLKSAYIE